MTQATNIRTEIVSALHDGFGGNVRIERTRQRTRVFVEDFKTPIVVTGNSIEVPSEFPPEIRAGINLDISAILAERSS